MYIQVIHVLLEGTEDQMESVKKRGKIQFFSGKGSMKEKENGETDFFYFSH